MADEDTTPTASTEAGPGFDSDDKPDLIAGSAGPAINDGRSSGKSVVFNGVKGFRGLQPAFHVIVIPDKDDDSRTDEDPGGYSGLHTEGRTYTFARGVPKTVSGPESAWLLAHPVLDFAKA